MAHRKTCAQRSAGTGGKRLGRQRPSGTYSKVAAPDEAKDSLALTVDDFITNKCDAKEGLYALRKADLFNLLCIPPFLPDGSIDSALIDKAIAYCEARRAMLLIDPPPSWSDKFKARDGIETDVGSPSKNAAVFFPRLRQVLDSGLEEEFVPAAR